MAEGDLAESVPPIVRAMGPGLSAAFGALLRGRQDRKNLEADRATVEGILQAGLTSFRYRGVAMELETFAESGQEEIERLATNVVNAMSKADSSVDWSKVNLAQFNPEFRRRWISEASNVSDETLQQLWAELLTGELESPGSVSNDTMSIARDMNKERAEEFQILCSAAICNSDGSPALVVGCGALGNNSLAPYGLSYNVLMRLAHHRLIVGDMNTYTTVAVGARDPTVVVRQKESAWLLRLSDHKKQTDEGYRIKGILFTPAGKELFAVVKTISTPAYTAAMLKHFKQEGWEAIPLVS